MFIDGSKVYIDGHNEGEGKKIKFHSRKRSEMLPRIYSSRNNAGSELLVLESQADSKDKLMSLESLRSSPKKNFMFGGGSAQFIFQTMSAVEPEGERTKAFQKRHSSVSSKFDKLADSKRMYVSPSNMHLNLQEKIYVTKDSK